MSIWKFYSRLICGVAAVFLICYCIHAIFGGIGFLCLFFLLWATAVCKNYRKGFFD